jgi:hypothetical protein
MGWKMRREWERGWGVLRGCGGADVERGGVLRCCEGSAAVSLGGPWPSTRSWVGFSSLGQAGRVGGECSSRGACSALWAVTRPAANATGTADSEHVQTQLFQSSMAQ